MTASATLENYTTLTDVTRGIHVVGRARARGCTKSGSPALSPGSH